MSISVYKFLRTKEFILSGGVNLMDGTLKMALLVPGFKYKSNMVAFSNVAGLEIPSTVHYQVGGITVPGVDVTTVGTTAELRIGDLAFESLNATISNFVIYADVTAQGIPQPLICYGVFPTDLVFKLSTLRLSWPNPLITW